MRQIVALLRGRRLFVRDAVVLEFLELFHLVLGLFRFGLLAIESGQGKMRLSRDNYIATQTIYYPGFTYGGLGEGLGMLGVLILLLVTSPRRPTFWWTMMAFVGLLAMQAVYWLITHRVNKFWLKDTPLTGATGGFFALDPMKQGAPSEEGSEGWTKLRNRWEYSHVLRAIFAVIALN